MKNLESRPRPADPLCSHTKGRGVRWPAIRRPPGRTRFCFRCVVPAEVDVASAEGNDGQTAGLVQAAGGEGTRGLGGHGAFSGKSGSRYCLLRVSRAALPHAGRYAKSSVRRELHRLGDEGPQQRPDFPGKTALPPESAAESGAQIVLTGSPGSPAPDLQQVIDAWPQLTDAQRESVLAVVRAFTATPRSGADDTGEGEERGRRSGTLGPDGSGRGGRRLKCSASPSPRKQCE